MSNMLWLPLDASAHGAEIDSILVMVHILMVVLFVGWGGFFLFAVVRFRQKLNPKADYAGVKGHTSTYIEAVLVTIELILLFVFSVPIWARHINTLPDEKDAVVVRVVAQQFTWRHHYPGADGKFGRTDIKLIDEASNPLGLDRKDPAARDDIVSGELRLPINRPVIIKLTSKDMIHSLGIPVMRVKQDAIPGMTIPVTFIPKKIGTFEIACSQLCGIGHSNMKGIVVVETRSEFDAWYAKESAASAALGEGGDIF